MCETKSSWGWVEREFLDLQAGELGQIVPVDLLFSLYVKSTRAGGYKSLVVPKIIMPLVSSHRKEWCKASLYYKAIVQTKVIQASRPNSFHSQMNLLKRN